MPHIEKEARIHIHIELILQEAYNALVSPRLNMPMQHAN